MDSSVGLGRLNLYCGSAPLSMPQTLELYYMAVNIHYGREGNNPYGIVSSLWKVISQKEFKGIYYAFLREYILLFLRALC